VVWRLVHVVFWRVHSPTALDDCLGVDVRPVRYRFDLLEVFFAVRLHEGMVLLIVAAVPVQLVVVLALHQAWLRCPLLPAIFGLDLECPLFTKDRLSRFRRALTILEGDRIVGLR